MAQDLKIVIAGVEYEIQGEDLASESTLKDLLQATKSRQASEKRTRNTEEQNTRRQSESLEKTKSAYQRTLEKTREQTSSSSSILSSAFDKVKGFIPGVGALGFVISGLVSGISATVGAIVEITGVLKELYSSGVRIQTSFSELALMAGTAGMSIADFGKYLGRNQLALSRFGDGSVKEGAKRVSQMARELTFTTANLSRLGLSVAEVSEYLLDYSEIQTNLALNDIAGSMRDEAANQRLMNGTVKYIKELDQLARTTGKTRSEIGGLIKQASMDPDLVSTMSALGLSQEKRDNITKFAATLSTLPGGDTLRAALSGMLQYGSAIGESGEALAIVAPGFGNTLSNIASQLKSGGLNYLEATNMLYDSFEKNAQQISDSLGIIPEQERTQAQKNILMAAQAALLRRAAAENEIKMMMKTMNLTKEAAQEQIDMVMEGKQRFEDALINLKSGFSAILFKIFANQTMIKIVTGLVNLLQKFSVSLTDTLAKVEGQGIWASIRAVVSSFGDFWNNEIYPLYKPYIESMLASIRKWTDYLVKDLVDILIAGVKNAISEGSGDKWLAERRNQRRVREEEAAREKAAEEAAVAKFQAATPEQQKAMIADQEKRIAELDKKYNRYITDMSSTDEGTRISGMYYAEEAERELRKAQARLEAFKPSSSAGVEASNAAIEKAAKMGEPETPAATTPAPPATSGTPQAVAPVSAPATTAPRAADTLKLGTDTAASNTTGKTTKIEVVNPAAQADVNRENERDLRDSEMLARLTTLTDILGQINMRGASVG